MAYCTNSTKFQIVFTRNGGEFLLETESRIKTDRERERDAHIHILHFPSEAMTQNVA